MRRWLLRFTVSVGLLLACSNAAAAAHVVGHTKQQAEVNMLRAVRWYLKARHMPGLVNPRTHLLSDNTEAVCRHRGRRRPGNRYVRFLCVVRPHVHARRQGLYARYRVLGRGRFKVYWLGYRRR